MSKQQKGAVFEREFARKLSLWWTSGVDRDVFWRSPNSGGFTTRLVQRGSDTKEIRTAGDIAAVKPEGDSFVRRVCLELKRGYGSGDLFTELRSGKSKLHGFMKQAREQAAENDIAQWWLVWKQDRKPALLFLPTCFFLQNPVYSFKGYSYNHLYIEVYNADQGALQNVSIVVLDEFLDAAVPKNDFRVVSEK